MDLITALEARKRFGLSLETLRLWRRDGRINGYDRRGGLAEDGARGSARFYSTIELAAAVADRPKLGRKPHVDLFTLIPPSNYLLVMIELQHAEDNLLAAPAFDRPAAPRRNLSDEELDQELAALETELGEADDEDDRLSDPAKVLPDLIARLEQKVGYDRLKHIITSLIEHGPAVTARLYPFTSEPDFERERRRRSEREEQHHEGTDADEVHAHLRSLTADD